MAGRIRQLMWQSNRRDPDEGKLGCFFMFLFIGLPLLIITEGQILWFVVGLVVPFLIYGLFTL
jgi:hypothetical protein